MSAIAQQIWKTAHEYGMHLVAVHRPGRLNERADRLSRWKKDSSDFRLRPALFQALERKWGPHSIDLFANRLNRQMRRYASWKPDPTAAVVDGMSLLLTRENPWCFPPEKLVGQLLLKAVREQATLTPVSYTHLTLPTIRLV